MKNIKKIFVLLLAVLSMSIVAFAENSTVVPITKIANSTEECNVFEIDFNLGSESKLIDIVFVLDKSSSTKHATLSEEFSDLLDQMMEMEAKFNIGVIVFYNSVSEETQGLIALNEENLETLKSAIKDNSNSGTNLHGALVKANEWLAANTSTPDNQKHVVVMSDYGSYLVDDGNGVGLTRYYKVGEMGYKIDLTEDTAKKYPDSDFTPTIEDINNLVVNQTLLNGIGVSDNLLKETGFAVHEYYYTISHQDNPDFSDPAVFNQLYEYSTIYDGILFENAPTMLEKSLYHSGRELLKMSEAGYNVHSITSDHAHVTVKKITDAFKSWVNSEIGTVYNESNYSDIAEIFDVLSEGMLNLIEEGTLVDEIAPEFDFVLESEVVLLNEVELRKEVVGDTVNFFREEETAPFVTAKYDGVSHTITWNILNQVVGGEYLEMMFKVKFNEANVTTPSSDDSYNTNLDATLNYRTVRGNGQVMLESPSVTVSNSCTIVPPPPVEKGDVIAHYVDEEGREIAKDEYYNGNVGEEYATYKKEIDGYIFIYVQEGSADVSGQFINGTLHVTYVYRKIAVPPTATYNTIPYGLIIGSILVGGLVISLFIERKSKKNN